MRYQRHYVSAFSQIPQIREQLSHIATTTEVLKEGGQPLPYTTSEEGYQALQSWLRAVLPRVSARTCWCGCRGRPPNGAVRGCGSCCGAIPSSRRPAAGGCVRVRSIWVRRFSPTKIRRWFLV